MAKLSPFQTHEYKLPETVLIVGNEGIGKHTVAQSLVDMAVTTRLKIHTCTWLPLPEDNHIYKTNVAFICFMMSNVNKDSFKTLLHNIGQVDVSYFLGRSAIIVNTSGSTADQLVATAHILNIGNQYGIQVFFVDVKDDKKRTELGRVLEMMIYTAQGYECNVTPLLLDTVQTETNTDRSRDTNLVSQLAFGHT